jgi:hypothetical protein
MSLIVSRNTLGPNGFTVGGEVRKDMTDDSCPSLDAEYAPNNIAITESLTDEASY